MMLISNNMFEPAVSNHAPRLYAAGASWPASRDR